jgi:hypothetical protein
MYKSYLTENTLFSITTNNRLVLLFFDSLIGDENHDSSVDTVTGFGLNSRGVVVRCLTEIRDSSLLRSVHKMAVAQTASYCISTGSPFSWSEAASWT